MTVNQMVNWVDREEITAVRERRMRRRLRKLPPKLRKFCLALKRVMVDERLADEIADKAVKAWHATNYSNGKRRVYVTFEEIVSA